MARTISQIYDAIIAEKQTLSALSDLAPASTSYAGLLAELASASKVAIWRLWAYVIATAIYTHETLWDLFKAEVTALIDANRWGSLPWYVTVAKQWQLGDTLTFVNDFPAYAVSDPAKRIVTQASAVESGGTVFVKAAKAGPNGSLVELAQAEILQFTEYMSQIKPAGVPLVVTSLPADRLRLTVTIRYNAILDPTVVRDAVISAINAYLKALPFDARFRRLAIEDAIQAVAGVRGIEIAAMSAIQGATTTAITQDFVSAAGHMVFDTANSTITMSAGA